MDEITDVEHPALTPAALVPAPAPDRTKVIRESENPANLSGDPGTSRRTGDLAVYIFYIRLIGCKIALAYLVLSMAYVVTLNFSSKSSLLVMDHQLIRPAVWLQRWTNVNTIHPNERVGYYFGIYGSIAAAAVVGFLWSDWYEVPSNVSTN